MIFWLARLPKGATEKYFSNEPSTPKPGGELGSGGKIELRHLYGAGPGIHSVRTDRGTGRGPPAIHPRTHPESAARRSGRPRGRPDPARRRRRPPGARRDRAGAGGDAQGERRLRADLPRPADGQGFRHRREDRQEGRQLLRHGGAAAPRAGDGEGRQDGGDSGCSRGEPAIAQCARSRRSARGGRPIPPRPRASTMP